MRRLAPALLLVSCVTGSGLTNPKGDDGEDTDQESPVRITRIDPDWGPPAGGTQVTITGVGFEGFVDVHFGQNAVNVTMLDEHTLLVSTPGVGIETVVDVTIESELGSTVLEDGFTYSHSAPDGDADTDADTDADPTGLTGGLVQFSRTQFACPSCLGYTADAVVYAGAALHPPVSGSWNAWLPANGTCKPNGAIPPLSGNSYDVGTFAYLQSGSRSVSMPRIVDGGGSYYENANLGVNDYISQQAWDLSASGAGSVPAIDLKDAVVTPYGFDTITPADLLQTAAGWPFIQPIDATTSNTFTWSPSGPGSFVILLDVYDSSGASYLGGVVCRGPDNGAMTVPGSHLLPYPPGALLVVYLIRYETTTSVLSHNGATVEGIGQSAVVGTATLY